MPDAFISLVRRMLFLLGSNRWQLLRLMIERIYFYIFIIFTNLDIFFGNGTLPLISLNADLFFKIQKYFYHKQEQK